MNNLFVRKQKQLIFAQLDYSHEVSMKSETDLEDKRLTVCVTCVWAGVDSAWEQEKLEARKMLENAAESHTSGARGVRRFCFYSILRLITAPTSLIAWVDSGTKGAKNGNTCHMPCQILI